MASPSPPSGMRETASSESQATVISRTMPAFPVSMPSSIGGPASSSQKANAAMVARPTNP